MPRNRLLVGQGLVTLTLAIALGATAAGCKKKDAQASDQNQSVTPSQTVIPGVVNDIAGFTVNVLSNDEGIYKLHESSAWDKACTVTSTSLDNDILCYVEGSELDFYFFGLRLNYNVPKNFTFDGLECTYVRVAPFYYYGFKPGTGPANASYDVNQNGTPVNQVNVDGMTPSCQYDYRKFNGPNCCLGTYTLSVRNWDPNMVDGNGDPAPGYGAPTLSQGEWGGDLASCLRGPAVDTQPKSASGFPLDSLTFIKGTGLNETYAVEAPIKKLSGTNARVANYFSDLDDLPAAISQTGHPYYEFTCLDRADEMVARIRVMAREWNLKSEFNKFVTNGTGDPEATVGDGADSKPNDILDWDDIDAPGGGSLNLGWGAGYPGG